MKKILFILISLFFIASLYAKTPEKTQLLPPSDSLALLETIKKNAIVFGDGDKEVHTFIDPLCSMSQLYLKFLFDKGDVMFKKYKIYLYLYELDGKHSEQTINTILSSEYKNTILRSVMLNKEDIILEDINDEAAESAHKIAEVAQKIGVFKRPYIMINGKVK
ncbi:MAG: hypothetical protein FP820_05385 [Sulfurimonas sp.]|nr:hypothetical protein [Sulfurimonas sp.]MBU3939829.1 hypothetical protein [bacterium]MBU4025058.1 hypothetical protein [bacterium]MBU4059715.1 hypothetical protein [bacterium]MBU4109690.1 hypothetical protein [bacterium]